MLYIAKILEYAIFRAKLNIKHSILYILAHVHDFTRMPQQYYHNAITYLQNYHYQ